MRAGNVKVIYCHVGLLIKVSHCHVGLYHIKVISSPHHNDGEEKFTLQLLRLPELPQLVQGVQRV